MTATDDLFAGLVRQAVGSPTKPMIATNDKLAAIRTVLTELQTHDLSKHDGERLVNYAHQLNSRVVCEAWGRKMGWTIPPYQTDDWDELRDAWLESADEEP